MWGKNNMNKKLLFIAISSVLTLSLLVFFAATGWDYFTQKETGKCGDGNRTCSLQGGVICAEKEFCSGNWIEANDSQRCCSKECNMPPASSDYESSRFGIYGIITPGDVLTGRATEEYLQTVTDILSDLQIHWTRSWLTFDISTDARKSYDFSKYDVLLQHLSDNGNSIYATAWLRVRKNDYGCGIENIEEYKNFVNEAVSRYSNGIKYWQVLKEPANICSSDNPSVGSDNGLTKEEAVLILQESAKIIREKCKDCKIIFGGFGSQWPEEYYEYILENAADDFDIQGALFYKELAKNVISSYSGIMEKYGIKKPIWNIEGSPSSICKNWGGDGTLQGQARYGVKLLANMFALGTEKSFWGMLTDFKTTNVTVGMGNFNYNGLLSADLEKKPAYYAFKLTIEKLDYFSKTTDIGKCSEKIQGLNRMFNGICAYKFEFSGKKPVYVLWNDSGGIAYDLSNYTDSNYMQITHIIEQEGQTESQTEIVPSNAIFINASPIFAEEK